MAFPRSGASHLAAAGYSLEDDSEDEASSVEHLELEGSQGAWDWVSSMRPKHETPSHQIAFPDLIFSGHILGQGWVLATGGCGLQEASLCHQRIHLGRTWSPGESCDRGGGLDDMELGVTEQ